MQQVVVAGNHLVPPCAVVVAKVDEIQLGVGKVDAPRGYVQRQPVGPVDFCAHNHAALRAVHADPLNTRIFAPICPEEPARALARIQRQSARLRDVLIDENHPVGSIGSRHFDRVEPRVQPVEILRDPIIGQPFDQVNTAAHQHDGVHSADLLAQAEYLLRRHVRPVDDVVLHIGGRCDNILHLDGDALKVVLGEVAEEEGATIGDNQEGVGMVDCLADLLVRLQQIARLAGAEVARRISFALRIGASLTARTRRFALVAIHTNPRVIG